MRAITLLITENRHKGKMIALNTQIEAYLEEPDRLKYHQKELIEIITSRINPSSSGEGLDIGCATGALIRNLSPMLDKYNFTGFDNSKDLIDYANKLNKRASSKFFVGDFNSIDFDKKFNLICAVGVLSIFEEFEAPLKKWLSWLSDDGIFYLFGGFNSRNIDTKILFRNNTQSQTKWEGGLTSYSIQTTTRVLKKLGYKCNFKKFHLPIDIKEDLDNPIRTYTETTTTGEKLVLCGANVVREKFFVTIEKDQDHEN